MLGKSPMRADSVYELSLAALTLVREKLHDASGGFSENAIEIS
jgi:hypothetical protein